MKRVLQVLAALVVLLLIAAGGLALFFDANRFRPMLEAELTRVLGRSVKVGDLKLALIQGSVTATDLSIADDPKFSSTPFVRAHSLKVGVELKPLIFDRKLNVTGITIEQPDIDLLQSAPGVWNFSSLGDKTAAPAPATPPTSSSALDLSVKNIKISDGRVSIGKPKGQGKPQVFDKVNIEVREFSPTSAIPFTLATDTSGAHVKLDGKVGPIAEKDAALTPVDAHIVVTNLDLSSSGFFDPATGIDGIVSLDGTVNSTGVSVVTKTKVKADKLKLAKNGTPAKRTVEFDFTIGHNVRKQSGILSAGAIHIGKADATLTGNYSVATSIPTVDLELNGPKMPISELSEMLPPLGVVLPQGSSLQGGTAHIRLSAVGPLDKLVVKGPLGLDKTRLAGFDLGSKLRTVASLAGIKVTPDTDIETLALSINHSPAGTDVEDLTFVAPTIGELAGAGTVSPAQQLDFKMKVKLHTGGNVLAAIGARGDSTIPFFIRGTSSNPSFVPDVKGIASEKASSILKSEKVNKMLEGSEAGKAAKGVLDSFFGKKK